MVYVASILMTFSIKSGLSLVVEIEAEMMNVPQVYNLVPCEDGKCHLHISQLSMQILRAR